MRNQIIDPMVRELLESAAIGEAARQFLESGLGKHITDKAAEEIEEAIAELCEADPGNSTRILALQTRINVAKQSIVYLVEAMTNGENALKQLEDE